MGATLMLVSAARLKGRTHDRCDDRFFFRKKGSSWHVAVLSDGAGSKSRASEGAKIATRTVAEFLADTLDGYWWGCPLMSAQALEKLPRRVIEVIGHALEPVRAGDPLSLFAGTLLFSACHMPSGRWIVGHLGDGVIGGVDADGELMTLSSPQNGEYANTTHFYTDKDAHAMLRLYLVRGVRGVVLMSDGSAHSLFRQKDARIAPALRKLFDWQRELGSAKGSAVLRANVARNLLPKTGDDCSLTLQQLNNVPRSGETRIIPIKGAQR